MANIHGSTVEWERIEYKECWNLEIKQGIGWDRVLSCKAIILKMATSI